MTRDQNLGILLRQYFIVFFNLSMKLLVCFFVSKPKGLWVGKDYMFPIERVLPLHYSSSFSFLKLLPQAKTFRFQSPPTKPNYIERCKRKRRKKGF
jgi:hypothetical protein